MIRLIVFSFLMGVATVGYTQDDTANNDSTDSKEYVNLVKNPSFEDVLKVPKKLFQISYAIPWIGPTNKKSKPDLFYKNSDGAHVDIPSNKYGQQNEFEDRLAYAGVNFYVRRGIKAYRTYLQGELMESMTKGDKYCISVKYSLADKSLYMVDAVHVVFHKKGLVKLEKKATTSNEIILDKEDFISLGTEGMDDIYEWTSSCAVYTAKGKEEYFIIGNFLHNGEFKIETLEKNKALLNVDDRMLPISYYYIDDINIRVLEDGESCICNEEKEEKEVSFIYGKSFSIHDNMDIEEFFNVFQVYFAQNSSDISADFYKYLDFLAQRMQKDPSMSILLEAFADRNEVVEEEKKFLPPESSIVIDRANAVKSYLLSKGIEGDRIVLSAERWILDIYSTQQDRFSLAKDRKVSFRISK